MQLSLEHRRVGDATVLACKGRLIAGPEAVALQKAVGDLMPLTRHLVLHLGEVDFIDSCGLGQLVRTLAHARHSRVSLSLCAVSPKVDEVLRVTKIKNVFPPYETEADALTDVHRRDRERDSVPPDTTVLCVDSSTNVETYLREVLQAAGYHTITAHNLPDALILLVATKPKIVVMSAELAAFRGTKTAEDFHRHAAGRVVTLPAGFSGHDAGEAASEVLRAVGAAAN